MALWGSRPYAGPEKHTSATTSKEFCTRARVRKWRRQHRERFQAAARDGATGSTRELSGSFADCSSANSGRTSTFCLSVVHGFFFRPPFLGLPQRPRAPRTQLLAFTTGCSETRAKGTVATSDFTGTKLVNKFAVAGASRANPGELVVHARTAGVRHDRRSRLGSRYRARLQPPAPDRP